MAVEYRVFGPPGTGKTTFLGKQIEKFIRFDDYIGEEIYVCSFTKAAAQAAAQGINELPDGEKDLIIPERNIGTLHSFCFRLLNTPIIAESKTKEYDQWTQNKAFQIDDSTSIDIDDPYGNESLPAKNNGTRLLSDVGKWRNMLKPESSWPIEHQRFYADWCAWKRETDYLDFTDLIERVIEYKYGLWNMRILLVDEAQDLVPMHWKLLRMWGDSSKCEKFIVAGDDDQAIYEWSGAVISEFLKPIAEENKYVLPHSHRIPSAIHDLSQAWIKPIRTREPKAFTPREEPGKVTFLKTQTYTFCSQLVKHIVETCDRTNETAMILAPTSHQLQHLIKTLRYNGVPFSNIYRKTNGAWNPLARRKKSVHGADRLYAFLKRPQLISDFKVWGECLLKSAFTDKNIYKEMCDYPETLELGESEYEILFGEAYGDLLFQGDIPTLNKFLTSKFQKSLEYPQRIWLRRTELEDIVKQPLITVGTIHSVKGGEADNVYVIPDLPNIAFAKWSTGDQDEIRRLFYVAFTRARHTLSILKPATRRAISLGIQ